jgi:glycerophosphoryl diester phosphodiesterase
MSPTDLKIIAHCGACTTLADNSLEALHLAVAEGADMVELDLRRTADDRIVVIHDATTFRMMGSGGTVAQMTFEDVRSLRGPRGERIASLKDVLTLPLPIIHELKVAGFEEELAEAISKRHDDIVSSYDHSSLDKVRAFNADIRLGYLWFRDDWRAVIEKAAAARAYSVHPSNYEVCPELVALAHANGLKVHVWSVGDAVRSTQLSSWGVDGIMTYTPRQTRDLIRNNVLTN